MISYNCLRFLILNVFSKLTFVDELKTLKEIEKQIEEIERE